MNIYSTDLYPFLSGDMLPADGVIMTIHRVRVEEIKSERGTEQKPVIYFTERPKGLILNKTNSSQIAKALGPETDDWIGAGLHIYPQDMNVAGKPRTAVRIRAIIPKEKHAARKKERPPGPDINKQIF